MRHWLRIYRQSRRKYFSGFTLVEMLVAATIFAIVGLGIMTSFSSGIKLWNRAKGADFVRCELLLGLEAVARDLRQSMNIEKIGFSGTATELSFPTLLSEKVEKVTYRFDADSHSFKVSHINLKDIESLKKEQEIIERVIFKVEEASFSYLHFDDEKNRYVWDTSWSKDNGVFLAVRLQVKLKGEEFVKTVFMPAS